MDGDLNYLLRGVSKRGSFYVRIPREQGTGEVGESYMGYIGMCRCEGYGFQAVYSGIGCINQSVWV